MADHVSESMFSISTVKRSNSSLVVEGYMNGRRCSFTLDTGAIKSVMNSNMFNKGNVRLIESHSNLVKITLGHCEIQTQVMIADFILRLDIMAAFGFIVFVCNEVLFIGNKEISF